MNNLIPLDFENQNIRIVDYNNESWWLLTDVCKALNIRNVTQAANRLDNDERSMLNIGRQGEAIIINEAGLNITIIRSNQAMKQGTMAYRFRRWITHEVLPSIRKYGSYPAPQAISYVDEPISNHEQTTLPQRFKQERLRWEAAENLSLANIPSMSKNIITAIESGMGGMTKGKRMQYMLYAGVDVLYIMTGRRTLTTAERAVRDAMRGGDDDVRAMLYARALQITN